MVNKVTLIGRLGQNPEVRRLENGTAVAKIGVATSEVFKDKNGERQEQTEWHNVVLWRWMAETAEQYLKKGSLVYIEGKLTSRKWQDKDGQEKYTTEVVANNIKLLEKREGGGGYTSNFPSLDDAPPAYTSSGSSTPEIKNGQPQPMSMPTAEPMGNEAADDLPF